jgi:hypothetical protein
MFKTKWSKMLFVSVTLALLAFSTSAVFADTLGAPAGASPCAATQRSDLGSVLPSQFGDTRSAATGCVDSLNGGRYQFNAPVYGPALAQLSIPVTGSDNSANVWRDAGAGGLLPLPSPANSGAASLSGYDNLRSENSVAAFTAGWNNGSASGGGWRDAGAGAR